MKKLTTVVLRHRALVTLVWLALTVVGGLFVGKANSGLTHTIATPGLAGYDANLAMTPARHRWREAPVIAVLRLPSGQTMRTSAGRRFAQRTFASAAHEAGHVALIDYATSHNRRFAQPMGTRRGRY